LVKKRGPETLVLFRSAPRLVMKREKKNTEGEGKTRKTMLNGAQRSRVRKGNKPGGKEAPQEKKDRKGSEDGQRINRVPKTKEGENKVQQSEKERAGGK